MIELYDREKNKICLLDKSEQICITSTLSSGDKEIKFSYPKHEMAAREITCECYLRTKTDEYVVKDVAEGDEKYNISATLNLEELETDLYLQGFESVEMTIRECLNKVLNNTGWKIGECQITKRRTIRNEQKCCTLEIIKQCIKTYTAEISYHSLSKTLDIFETVGEYKGSYFMDSLNIRKMRVAKNSYDFYTRIIPIGKDNLFIDVDGKNYIENMQYCNKVKTLIWKDERYVRTDALIEDATKKLSELSKPYSVYEVEVMDLASLNIEFKEIFQYSLGDTILLISKEEKIKEKQRIVKMYEYPMEQDKNKCELSSVIKSFADIQADVAEQTNDITQAEINKALETANEYSDKMYAAMEQYTKEELKRADDKINSLSGFYDTTEIKVDGTKIYYIHDKPELKESSVIWKMTVDSIAISTDGGKTYAHGITADGDAIMNIIKAKGIKADYITAGIMRAIELSGCKLISEDEINGRIEINGGKLQVESYDKSARMRFDTSGLDDLMMCFGNNSFDYNTGLSTVEGKRITTPTIIVGTAASNKGNDLLSVNGNTACYGDIYCMGEVKKSSDIRLKNVISEIKGKKFEKILKHIRTVIFEWKNKERGNKKYFGVLAQDLQKNMGGDGYNIVSTENDGYMSVAYQEMIPILLSVINWHSERIDCLESNVKNMEKKGEEDGN